MLFVTCGVTVGAAVPETAVKFVHSVCLGKKTIDRERGPGHVILVAIVHVLKVMVLGGMRMIQVSVCHHVVSFQVFVGELIHGLLTELVIHQVNNLRATHDWLTRLCHPPTGSLARLLGIVQLMRRSWLQAEAMVTCSNGSPFWLQRNV